MCKNRRCSNPCGNENAFHNIVNMLGQHPLCSGAVLFSFGRNTLLSYQWATLIGSKVVSDKDESFQIK